MSDRKRILMVDDDPLLCEVTQEILEEIGYDCVAVSDGEGARAALLDSRCRFDLMILDHVLPGASGVELTADFLSLCPDLPIVLYTGALVSLEDVRSKGITAVIPKPLTKSELVAALGPILGDPL